MKASSNTDTVVDTLYLLRLYFYPRILLTPVVKTSIGKTYFLNPFNFSEADVLINHLFIHNQLLIWTDLISINNSSDSKKIFQEINSAAF